MDEVFKALSDPTRRKILDLLRRQDGLTLGSIEQEFSDMTRFGVMKHLKILEQALLVVTHKNGRFKYHYLNVVPIQHIAERWISAFAAPWAQTMTRLQTTLERTPVMSKPKQIFVSIIKTTPSKLWAALTDPEHTQQYYYGGRFEGTLKPGEAYRYAFDEENALVSGEILELEKDKKLVMSFSGHWMPDMENDAPSRVTYTIQQEGEFCRLTMIHDDFDGETATYLNTSGGWPGILSGLKTYLETGKPFGYQPMMAA